MQSWKQRLSEIGEVETFDYDYMRESRRRPDPLPKLIATHRATLASVRAKTDAPIFLIGKSMGGRIGCHVALEEDVAGVICLGYPLCGGGDTSKMRDEVLRHLRRPILFLQGTRDPLCPLELLEQVRGQMMTKHLLYVVEGGDHSLRVLVRGGKNQADVDQEIVDAIGLFIRETPMDRHPGRE